MTLKTRITAPTPGFFRKLRKIGLAMAGVGTAIVAAQVTLPVLVVTVGGYLLAAGAATAAVSQAVTTVEGQDEILYD